MIGYSNRSPALISADSTISYAMLAGAIAGTGDVLAPVRPQRVVIFAENRLEWVYALYGAWHVGAAVVPIDATSNAADAAYILADCRPQTVFCSQNTRAVLDRAAIQAGYTGQIIHLDDLPGPAETRAAPCSVVDDPERTALIIYTSGTTGSPKGVMLSFRNIIANINGVCHDVPIYQPTDRILVLLPLHHIFPLLGTIVIALYTGATAVFSPSMVPADIMATLKTHRITMILGVPRLYDAFRRGIEAKITASGVARRLFAVARSVGRLAFSRRVFGSVQRAFGGSIRFMISGGSRLDVETAIFFRTLGFDILEGYGMTEAAPMITFTRPGAFRAGSAGQALPATRIEIRDDEITASGANIMTGYFERPDETADVLRDGWLYTGDLGRIDSDGYVFITGRRKEILILGNGKNINPVEIESALEGIDPLVAEVAVTVIDDRLHAIIRPDPVFLERESAGNPVQLVQTKIIDPYNREATPYKAIQGLTVTDRELPRTSMGKLRRFMLDTYVVSDGDESRVAMGDLPDSEEWIVIRDYLAMLTGRDVTPDDHLDATLGLDSLDKVTFQVFLKKTFGMEIEQMEMSSVGSIGAISALVHERRTRIEVSEVQWADVLRETSHVPLPTAWITRPLIRFCAILFLRSFFRISSKNADALPDGPCIIAPNHQSYMDGLLVVALMRYRHFAGTFFYAKAQHVRSRWLRFIADRHRVIVMDTDRDITLSLQKLAQVLKSGRKIIIFPEGTRSRSGRLGVFRSTFAILSRELAVPVVPVTISGAGDALPPGARLPRPFKRISVTFQDPVYPENESYESLAMRIRDRVRNLLPDRNQ
ncbi:AMP-binding protein [bacterium]|nr:AMP-binding protein [candidate division CSSED10-310 bacterium]